jgi:hypothetical protein
MAGFGASRPLPRVPARVGYLLLRERELRRLVGAARRHQEQALFKAIAAIAGPDRETWLPRLLAPIEEGGINRLEWLGAVPSGRGPTSLEAQIDKVGFLKELGADRLVLADLRLQASSTSRGG